MVLGVDTIFTQTTLDLKEQGHHIALYFYKIRFSPSGDFLMYGISRDYFMK